MITNKNFHIHHYLEQNGEPGDDALWVASKNDVIWFCIADGAGGSGNGYVASHFIVEAFKELISDDSYQTPCDFEELLRNLDTTLQRLHNGPQSTAIIGKIVSGIVIGASVGDSEAWLFNADYKYELTSLQLAKPLLGSGQAQPIGFGPVALENALLLGSDGLFNYADSNAISSAIKCGSGINAFVELAKAATGELQDDLAIVLITPSA